MDDNKILEAVKQLDPTNDNHWTAAGEPRLETVRMLASDSSLSRDQVSKAAPDFSRTSAQATPPADPPAAPTPSTPVTPPVAPTTPAPPAAPASGETTPPAPTEPAPPPPSAPDEAVRGDIGVAAPVPPAPPAPVQTGPVPGEDVDGKPTPQPDGNMLHTDAPADGLPTAFEPIAIEGAKDMGLNVDDVSSKTGPGAAPNPQIAKGTTTLGYNAFNSEEDDIVDALASVAPSPNAPTGLGGPLPLEDMQGVDVDGLTTPADVSGETQLATLDRGHPGDPEAIESLEAELRKAQKLSEKLRGQADEINSSLSKAAQAESAIRAQIEVATPRTSVTEAIQGYFGAQDAAANQRIEALKLITDSGIDFKELERITQRSPLDTASVK